MLKVMNFLIFRDLFHIFLNLFRFLNNKNELRKGQKAGLFRAGPTWM